MSMACVALQLDCQGEAPLAIGVGPGLVLCEAEAPGTPGSWAKRLILCPYY